MMCDINIHGIGNLYVYEIANWKKASGVVFTDKKLQFGNSVVRSGNGFNASFTDKFRFKT